MKETTLDFNGLVQNIIQDDARLSRILYDKIEKAIIGIDPKAISKILTDRIASDIIECDWDDNVHIFFVKIIENAVKQLVFTASIKKGKK